MIFPTGELTITEGELLVVGLDDISKLRSELTPLTVVALDAFSKKQAAN
jgi:hypothetical protein